MRIIPFILNEGNESNKKIFLLLIVFFFLHLVSFYLLSLLSGIKENIFLIYYIRLFLLQITLVLVTSLIISTISKLMKSEAIWITYHVIEGFQGILISMLVTCNCQVVKLYTRNIKSRRSKSQISYQDIVEHTRNVLGKSSITKSTSLQLLTWEPSPDAV